MARSPSPPSGRRPLATAFKIALYAFVLGLLALIVAVAVDYVISQYVQDQCGYVNMCWSWKRSLGFPISRLWEEMRHQWSTRNAYRRIRGEIEIPKIVFLKTWEDLLSGQPIWFSGTILQLVLGKGLVYREV